jgi:16S rRNA C967 or C1407 C5-methylase (RsmB/RsmF family)
VIYGSANRLNNFSKVVKDTDIFEKENYDIVFSPLATSVGILSPSEKNNGTLVYCTCSLSKKEGEEQISMFLKRHSNFKTVPIHLPDELKDMKTPEGWIRILPHHLAEYGGADGFFIALLTKE